MRRRRRVDVVGDWPNSDGGTDRTVPSRRIPGGKTRRKQKLMVNVAVFILAAVSSSSSSSSSGLETLNDMSKTTSFLVINVVNRKHLYAVAALLQLPL
jgi:hypothetical protein